MGIQDREYYRGEEGGLHIDLRRQSMVANLIIANVAVFFANMFTSTAAHPDWLIEAMVSRPQDLSHVWDWWHLLSSGFAHDPANIMHLVGNMAGLFFLGRDVEQRLGRREFLAFYLTVLVLSALASCVRQRLMLPEESWRGALGASGGVIAVVVLYAFYFPTRQLLLMFVFPLPAWAVAVLFILFDMFGLGDNVAHDVHLAGAALGAAYYLLGIRLTSWTARLPSRRPRLRVLKPDNDEELEREGDRLLEKVHQQGEESLTAKERKLLQRYSRLLRRKREL